MKLEKTHFPYCIQRIAEKTYIVLNRNYKPIGYPGLDWVDYKTHPAKVILNITPRIAQKLSVHKDDSIDCVYLFTNTPTTFSDKKLLKEYFDRLVSLSKLTIKN
jgi:hypothetical protein